MDDLEDKGNGLKFKILYIVMFLIFMIVILITIFISSNTIIRVDESTKSYDLSIQDNKLICYDNVGGSCDVKTKCYNEDEELITGGDGVYYSESSSLNKEEVYCEYKD